MRDPELADHFWVNPVGVPMHRVRASQLMQVDHQGHVVRGEGAVNPVGLLLHTALHRARPDVTAVCHAHAPAASTWAALAPPLDPITQDACVFHGQQALITAPRLARDPEAAERFADDAAWLASTLGSPRFGWLSFQMLWDDIVSSDPDLRD